MCWQVQATQRTRHTNELTIPSNLMKSVNLYLTAERGRVIKSLKNRLGLVQKCSSMMPIILLPLFFLTPTLCGKMKYGVWTIDTSWTWRVGRCRFNLDVWHYLMQICPVLRHRDMKLLAIRNWQSCIICSKTDCYDIWWWRKLIPPSPTQKLQRVWKSIQGQEKLQLIFFPFVLMNYIKISSNPRKNRTRSSWGNQNFQALLAAASILCTNPKKDLENYPSRMRVISTHHLLSLSPLEKSCPEQKEPRRCCIHCILAESHLPEP